MAETCSSCKGTLSSHDGFDSCIECGLVTERTNFQVQDSESGVFCGPSGAYQSDLASRKDLRVRVSKSTLIKWKTIISNGGDGLRLNKEVIKRATNMFEAAYKSSNQILLRREVYKRGLCATCLHIACQENDLNIPLRDICEEVQASMSACYKAKKDLKGLTELNIKVKLHDRFDKGSIQICLKKYAMDEVNLTGVTLKIINLAKDTQIEAGCNAEPLILAAAILASQSVNTKSIKGSFDTSPFSGCQSIISSVQIRLHELRQMLHSMVKVVPWIDSSKLKPKEAIKYLDEVIRHHKSRKLCRVLSDSEDEEDTPMFIPKRPKKHNAEPSENHGSHSVISRIGHDLECPELGEDDIPESEMHQYLNEVPKPSLEEFN